MDTILFLLYFSFILILRMVMAGFLLGPLIVGLFRLYDRLPRRVALSLKLLTLGPPLVLGMAGLVASFKFLSLAAFFYVFSGLFVYCGLKIIYDRLGRPLIKQLVGSGLLVTAALPFILVGLGALVIPLQSETFSFYVQNYSDHEIIVKEVQIDEQMVFTGVRRLECCLERSLATMPSNPEVCGLFLKADFPRWPKKIRLLAFDSKLQKEVRGEVRLPYTIKHSSPYCSFNIVYRPEGFSYENVPCW